MGEERDNFWQLERANRRKTVEAVVFFVLIYGLVGLGLDFLFHTVRLVNHHLIGFPALTVATALIASAQAARAYCRGSSVLLVAVGAHELLASESPKTQMVANVVDEIALAARVPRPRLYLMEDPAPNAFASGRDPAHSVICVTRGLVDQMDREELQGVIAHEVAHIRGHDTRLTQMATVMIGGFALLAGPIWRLGVAQSRGKSATIPGFGLVALPLLIFGGIGWIFSKMTAIALSRQREYLADASAVEFTRNPVALIRALEHIARIESPLKQSLRGAAPLFIVDPFERGNVGWTEYLDEVARIEAEPDKSKEQRDAEVAQYMARGVPSIRFFQNPFSSHPPIYDRILRLRGLLHVPSEVPQESAAELLERRKAAARTVSEITQANPAAMAAMIEGLLRANPAQQIARALGPDSASPDLQALEPSNWDDTAADPEEAVYRKLYNYNLSLTGDRLRLEDEHRELPTRCRPPWPVREDRSRSAASCARACDSKRAQETRARNIGCHTRPDAA